MRRPIVAGNWKMYTRSADAHILATAVRNSVMNLEGIEVIICPPALWVSEVLAVVGRGGKIELGVQNMYFEAEGAYTGEISPLMVRDVAKYVIIGHSERRAYFGENNLDVNEKVLAALRSGLVPIICVGERKREGLPKEPRYQLEEALHRVPKKHYRDVIVAYEPVWAIGTGENAEPEYVAKVVSYLREVGLADTPVLYGGSVNSKNVEGYARRPEIDGLLVGSASVRAAEFASICQTWAKEKIFKA
ncbi:MAG: Triosephosphate isomerase [bacterium ADurb.Bin400]|nr:MAG: Triosephosphate isomerase [bacterium ADurb.Bin400]